MLPGTQEWMVRDKRITSVWHLDTLTKYASALTNKSYTRNTKNLIKTVSMWVESLVNTTQTLWLLQHKAGDPTDILQTNAMPFHHGIYYCSVCICVYLVSFSQGLWLRHVLEGSILCIYLINIFSYTVFLLPLCIGQYNHISRLIFL